MLTQRGTSPKVTGHFRPGPPLIKILDQRLGFPDNGFFQWIQSAINQTSSQSSVGLSMTCPGLDIQIVATWLQHMQLEKQLGNIGIFKNGNPVFFHHIVAWAQL